MHPGTGIFRHRDQRLEIITCADIEVCCFQDDDRGFVSFREDLRETIGRYPAVSSRLDRNR